MLQRHQRLNKFISFGKYFTQKHFRQKHAYLKAAQIKGSATAQTDLNPGLDCYLQAVDRKTEGEGTHETGWRPWTNIFIPFSALCTCLMSNGSSISDQHHLIRPLWNREAPGEERLSADLFKPPLSSKQTRAFDLALVSTTVPNLTPVWLLGRGKAHHKGATLGRPLPWGFGR